MKPDWQNESADDELDHRMKALRSPDTPDDLLPRCLKTIVPAGEGTVVRREMSYQSDQMCPGTRSLDKMRWFMRSPVSRVAAAAVFILAVTGVALWFYGSGATSAAADFIQPILEAKTAKFNVTSEMKGQLTVTGKAIMELAPNRSLWEAKAAGSSRMVVVSDAKMEKGLILWPDEKRAMGITFTNSPKEIGSENELVYFQSLLLATRDKPDLKRELLGEKDIDGHRVVGYRLSGRGLGEWPRDTVMSVWGDPKTGLPVRVEIQNSKMGSKITVSGFVFNVELDESLFSVEPPAGYTVQSEPMDFFLSEEPKEKDLIETLRHCSNLSRGSFPDNLDWPEIVRKQIDRDLKSGVKASEEQIKYVMKEAEIRPPNGLRFAFQLPPEADAHYAGKGVSLGAADQPIFWYRPKDAKKYRVIYADLSVREADTLPSVPHGQPVPAQPSPKQ